MVIILRNLLQVVVARLLVEKDLVEQGALSLLNLLRMLPVPEQVLHRLSKPLLFLQAEFLAHLSSSVSFFRSYSRPYR